MNEIAKILDAISGLLWPIIVIGVIIYFRDALKAVISSAKGRKFSLKVAGNKLTMEEVTEQQRSLISDVQNKLARLEESIRQIKGNNESEFQGPEEKLHPVRNILWVDDHPKNNSFLIANLEEMGINVKTALSTDDALRIYKPDKFDRIISDMGRPEHDHAGIDLTEKIRISDKRTPIYIFCGKWAADNLKEKAEKAGVNGITSSGIDLLRMLNI